MPKRKNMLLPERNVMAKKNVEVKFVPDVQTLDFVSPDKSLLDNVRSHHYKISENMQSDAKPIVTRHGRICKKTIRFM